MMLIPSVLSFFISVITAIFLQQIFFRYNKIDPINHRSSHTSIATRTGGISIFLALFGTSIYLYFKDQELFDFSLIIPLSIMFIIGIYDDFYNANFKLKFFIQIIVAKILIDQGLIFNNFYGLFGVYEIPWILAQLSTIFIFLVVVNAFNFIDGIDGLAISIFLKFLLFFSWVSKDNLLQPLSFVVISSIIPLYYFNFRTKNKVFLGDAGSLLLGTLSCVYIFNILSINHDVIKPFIDNKIMLFFVLMLFPLVDLVRVVLIRLKNKKSPFEADNKHIHHYVSSIFRHHIFSVIIIITVETILQFLFIYSYTLYIQI